MGRFALLPTIMVFYVSMTCVHIPFRFKSPGEYRPRSAFLLAENTQTSRESSNFKSIPSSEFEKKPVDYIIRPDTSNVKMDIYNIAMPEFIRGIYLTNSTASDKDMLLDFIKNAKSHKINTFVVDVQKSMIPREHVDMIKKAGIFPVARIVVFLGGLNQKTPDPEYINKIIDLIDASAYQGFLEVQLDYIRYADSMEMSQLPLSFKYQTISAILKKAQEKASSLSLFLSADLFGRVTINENDQIGQKLENFARYMDTIYPMLYPSHYTNDDYRISHPYETVKEGVENSRRRCENTRIVAYIQGFSWKVDQSGKSMKDYIKAQFQAVEDARGHGWVIWNARNDYEESFKAISEFDSGKRRRFSENLPKIQPNT